jgi:hypothetical protein
VFLGVLGARLYLAHSRNLGGWRGVLRMPAPPPKSTTQLKPATSEGQS